MSRRREMQQKLPASSCSCCQNLACLVKAPPKAHLPSKRAFVDHLESIGLLYTRFFVGMLASQATWLTGFVTNGNVNHIARGDAIISFTAEDDIAGFIAHVLKSLPPATLENKDLRVQGDWLIFDDLAVLLKTESVEVEVMPGSDSELKGMLHKL